MGLDAYVLCACFREGKTKPHPLPDLLIDDAIYGPGLDQSAAPTLEQWLLHDRWRLDACEHKNGELIHKRLGNMSWIGAVRADVESIERTSSSRFPLVLDKVVFDGTHSGDWIPPGDVPELSNEVSALREFVLDEFLSDFVRSMSELCEASLKTGNPILF